MSRGRSLEGRLVLALVAGTALGFGGIAAGTVYALFANATAHVAEVNAQINTTEN